MAAITTTIVFRKWANRKRIQEKFKIQRSLDLEDPVEIWFHEKLFEKLLLSKLEHLSKKGITHFHHFRLSENYGRKALFDHIPRCSAGILQVLA